MRAVPLGASGDVITAVPPKACTAAAISSLSVATTTALADSDRRAASQVWAMSGRPVSASSIFRGRRVLDRRAGITITAELVFMGVSGGGRSCSGIVPPSPSAAYGDRGGGQARFQSPRRAATIIGPLARVAELADAQDSGSCPGNWVEVQVLSRAFTRGRCCRGK